MERLRRLIKNLLEKFPQDADPQYEPAHDGVAHIVVPSNSCSKVGLFKARLWNMVELTRETINEFELKFYLDGIVRGQSCNCIRTLVPQEVAVLIGLYDDLRVNGNPNPEALDKFISLVEYATSQFPDICRMYKFDDRYTIAWQKKRYTIKVKEDDATERLRALFPGSFDPELGVSQPAWTDPYMDWFLVPRVLAGGIRFNIGYNYGWQEWPKVYLPDRPNVYEQANREMYYKGTKPKDMETEYE